MHILKLSIKYYATKTFLQNHTVMIWLLLLMHYVISCQCVA
ncbi:hypothetical protein CCP4SC76_4420017 [Gammaproteobacteria bacterium]